MYKLLPYDTNFTNILICCSTIVKNPNREGFLKNICYYEYFLRILQKKR